MIQHNYYYVELNFRPKRVVFTRLKNFSLTIFRRVPKREICLEKGLQQTFDAIFVKEKIKESHRHDAIVVYLCFFALKKSLEKF